MFNSNLFMLFEGNSQIFLTFYFSFFILNSETFNFFAEKFIKRMIVYWDAFMGEYYKERKKFFELIEGYKGDIFLSEKASEGKEESKEESKEGKKEESKEGKKEDQDKDEAGKNGGKKKKKSLWDKLKGLLWRFWEFVKGAKSSADKGIYWILLTLSLTLPCIPRIVKYRFLWNLTIKLLQISYKIIRIYILFWKMVFKIVFLIILAFIAFLAYFILIAYWVGVLLDL